jgi:hypothetical protein
MKISQLINELAQIAIKHGDLPCGGENDIASVRLTVCDEEGHDAESGEDYCGPAHSVFIEVW